MRIVFMGSSEFAVPSLKALSAKHRIVGVVTQPDRPRGRGREYAATPVKQLAKELNLPLHQPERIKDPTAVSWLKELSPEVIVVVAYGQILPAEVLSLPPMGCINLHGSLLPRYRGAAPIQWSIIRGEKETGISTMFMDEGLDTGDVLLQRRVPLPEDITGGEVYTWLSQEGARLLVETINRLEAGDLSRTPQDSSLATYAPPLRREDERIRWELTAREIHNLVRGLNPQPGAYTTIGGKPLKIWRTSLSYQEGADVSAIHRHGEIVKVIKGEGLLVQTGKGRLLVTEVQPVGKKRMSADAFARGYRVGPGVLMGTQEG